MRAPAWHGKRDVGVDTVPDPAVRDADDVVIRVRTTGLCGSDPHLYGVLGTGAPLLGYTKLHGQVPGGQAQYLRVPLGNTRFVHLPDVLPTAWQAVWQAVEYADVPPGGSGHRLPLEEAPDAYEMFQKKHDGVVKVLLTP